MSTHAEDLKLRLMTVDLLRNAKKQYTYRELANKTGLPVTVLSRYAKGHVLPNTSRAKHLEKVLTKLVGLEIDLRTRIHEHTNDDGYFNNTGIIGNLSLLRQAAHQALSIFAGKRVTKVLTAAVDGIPLASMVADALGVDLVIAKRNKEVGVPSFLEETYVLRDSGVTMTLYIPKHTPKHSKNKKKKTPKTKPIVIKRGDSVLIVDDMIKSGETEAALVRLVQKAKADVSGIFSLIAVGDEWKKRIELPKRCPIEVITRIKSKK